MQQMNLVNNEEADKVGIAGVGTFVSDDIPLCIDEVGSESGGIENRDMNR